MSEQAVQETHDISRIVEIVSAYVSNNPLPQTELPTLIASVATALKTLTIGGAAPAAEAVEKPTPTQIRKSVTPVALISFIDGRPYKTLKRHLSKHGLDPVSYRERFGLPSDYPMVSSNYSEQRSHLAKSLGLGRLGAEGRDAAAEKTESKTTAKAAPKQSRRGKADAERQAA